MHKHHHKTETPTPIITFQPGTPTTLTSLQSISLTVSTRQIPQPTHQGGFLYYYAIVLTALFVGHLVYRALMHWTTTKQLLWVWLCGGKKRAQLYDELTRLNDQIAKAEEERARLQKKLAEEVRIHSIAKSETASMKVILDEVEKDIGRLKRLFDLRIADAEAIQEKNQEKP